MKTLPIWTIIFPLSTVLVVGVLCLTVVRFQEGSLQMYVESPGWLRAGAGVNKGGGESGRNQNSSLPKSFESKSQQCPNHLELKK